jgi:hypothetical protein
MKQTQPFEAGESCTLSKLFLMLTYPEPINHSVTIKDRL